MNEPEQDVPDPSGSDPSVSDPSAPDPSSRAPEPWLSRSSTRLWIAGIVVVGALGFLVFQGLGNATLYFRTADEAVAQRQSLGDRRFRIEGDVVDGSVVESAGSVRFLLTSKGVNVPVTHQGDPPELFRPGIPVVLEGRFSGPGNDFASDRILVKHSETYVADNPGRVKPTTPP